MLSFKQFLLENIHNGMFMHHFDPAKHDPNDLTQEELVQKYHFGSNDYLPFQYMTDEIKESIAKHPTNPLRSIIKNDFPDSRGPAGLVVPSHILEGGTGKGGRKIPGMDIINKMRANVYGSEHRAPLSDGDMLKLHKSVLEEHFSKSEEEQKKAEKEALGRLREAGHINKTADTLDAGEKTDTVNHEYDEQNRSFMARSSKGIAGHSFYTSGAGKDQKHHIINTCSGQTVGCGGGVDAKNIADTSRGSCFAPNSEIQYVNAAIRRHCQTQAMLDPKMSRDWILAHTGSLRKFAQGADKKNKRALFRPNVLNEMDRGSSNEVLHHLNKQRGAKGLPPIIANSYGKTNEPHDPKNNVHVTYSNTGPKVKISPTGNRQPTKVTENIKRDANRILQTQTSTNKSGVPIRNRNNDIVPPKGSYMVISARRGSPTDQEYQKNTKSIKYWSTGTPVSKLPEQERNKPDEAHYDASGRMTTPENAHYGHKTLFDEQGNKIRFNYQMHHVLHPRLVAVGKNKDGSDHMIPTDSRFKDTEHLPEEKNRFKSSNGQTVGGILVTTPTTSTSIEQHHTSFTHHVDDSTVDEIKRNNGVHEIDKPEDQMAATEEYEGPKPKAVSTTITAGKGKVKIQ